ncbi:signal peptidase I [Caldalkalibacillus mannanilyticus]|uniref:signal peptidase I n=1 Tax=Caldalkalibacillus mannanilyticus TaxID=1418 RepID=UPI000469FDE8|nr:signal peptidase I [Caldalkalibacillus mannanilyticus]
MDQSYQDDDLVREEESNKTNETWEWIKALAIAVIIAVGIRYLLFSPIVVDGESMMPTLQDRERMIVNKIVYFIGEPERGDIIVFHATQSKDWIKRVIGLPGDKIEMKNDVLYINDEVVDEPYLVSSKESVSGVLTDDFSEVVPEGHLYVLGDNRRNSRDSRWIGSIPIEDVVGRADVVFWPIQNIRIVK